LEHLTELAESYVVTLRTGSTATLQINA